MPDLAAGEADVIQDAISPPKSPEKSPAKVDAKGDTKYNQELKPWPQYIEHRLQLWDKFAEEYRAEIAAKSPQSIKVTLPDGAMVDGESWRTTPYDVAAGISKGLANSCIISKVNGKLWDLDRVLEADCSLELLKFDCDEAKAVYWHSTAHVLGEAMERFYGGCLCYGPPIENGFYYDMFMEDSRTAKQEDFGHLDGIIKCIVRDGQPFERLELTKDQLLQMFDYNQFKVRIINERVKTPKTTVYRCGPLIDLCLGPHVRHTGKIKSWMLNKCSSAFWEGDSTAESLQRVYGISFPDPKELKEWKRIQEEAAARDHRKIGKDQELFFFSEMSPGSAFFHPKGALINNKLCQLIREEYRKRGFQEVISPNIYSSRLWETSGHWQHYAKNMFCFDVEKQPFGLKPMNCPGHCLMFDSRTRSYKELPLRWADFGVLHRNELSGALTGLIRVRRFQQDDAHIFCRPDQVADEVRGGLEFLQAIYGIFGFDFRLRLSTRPEDFLGEAATWDIAEQKLKEGLDSFGKDWSYNHGDGAFYGPKIDITLLDALRREHQCATLQLDFQLPQRFQLSYMDENGEAQRPVMIHRAILGSVERLMAVLCEHYAGKWPFWVSPRQAMVVPIHSALNDHVEELQKRLYAAGFEVECDVDPGLTLNKKVRNAQLAQFNFILVVGEKEMTNGTVNVRTRDNKVRGEVSIEELIQRFQRLANERVQNSEEQF